MEKEIFNGKEIVSYFNNNSITYKDKFNYIYNVKEVHKLTSTDKRGSYCIRVRCHKCQASLSIYTTPHQEMPRCIPEKNK